MSTPCNNHDVPAAFRSVVKRDMSTPRHAAHLRPLRTYRNHQIQRHSCRMRPHSHSHTPRKRSRIHSSPCQTSAHRQYSTGSRPARLTVILTLWLHYQHHEAHLCRPAVGDAPLGILHVHLERPVLASDRRRKRTVHRTCLTLESSLTT